MAGNRDYDEDRFAELVLYVAWKTRDESDYGRLKVAKTLFYSDLCAFAERGQSLTGATYEHWQHGPFPPTLYAVEERLEAEGIVRVEGSEGRLRLREKPATPHFEDDAIVDHYIAKFAKEDTWKVRGSSHQHPGWWITGDREEIPYHVAFMSRREPTEDDFERGEELAQKYGWP